MLKMKCSNYRMVKGMVALLAPPKRLLHVATHTEKDRYTLIEQSAYLTLLKIVAVIIAFGN